MYPRSLTELPAKEQVKPKTYQNHDSNSATCYSFDLDESICIYVLPRQYCNMGMTCAFPRTSVPLLFTKEMLLLHRGCGMYPLAKHPSIGVMHLCLSITLSKLGPVTYINGNRDGLISACLHEHLGLECGYLPCSSAMSNMRVHCGRTLHSAKWTSQDKSFYPVRLSRTRQRSTGLWQMNPWSLESVWHEKVFLHAW